MVEAYNAWEEARSQGKGAEREFCRSRFVSRTTMRMLSNLRVICFLLCPMQCSPQICLSLLLNAHFYVQTNRSANLCKIFSRSASFLHPEVVRRGKVEGKGMATVVARKRRCCELRAATATLMR